MSHMKHFALMYETVDDFIEKRAPFREAHLSLARGAHNRGELLMAGALSDPGGALLVFYEASRDVVDRFAQSDPYVIQRLVKSWTARPWVVVIGGDSN
jgi:uncharacterized protein